MNATKYLRLLALLALTLALVACSQEESITEQVSQKVDRINTENADTAVKAIRSPIDKAQATQNLSDERTKEINEAMKNQ